MVPANALNLVIKSKLVICGATKAVFIVLGSLTVELVVYIKAQRLFQFRFAVAKYP